MKCMFVFLLSICIGSVLSAANLEPQVNDQGMLSITCDGRTIVETAAVLLMNEKYEPVSNVLAAQLRTFRGKEHVRNIWASDEFVVERVTRRTAAGEVKVVWEAKFLRAIPMAKYFVVVLNAPIRNSHLIDNATRIQYDDEFLTLKYSGAVPKVFAHEFTASKNAGEKMFMVWNYDSAKVNRINSEIIIGVSVKNIENNEKVK